MGCPFRELLVEAPIGYCFVNPLKPRPTAGLCRDKLAVSQTSDGHCRSLTPNPPALSRSCLLALLSSLTLSTRCDGGRIQRFDGGGEMTDEKLERQQRERQAMRQAIANYAGPITKCPPGRTTKDRHGWPKQRTQEKARRIRNSENTPSSD